MRCSATASRGSPAPPIREGRARLGDDGHSLQGRWSFASGIRHCEWVLANAIVEHAVPPSDAEHAIPRAVGSIVPIGSVEIEDSWHVMGLEGTGSNHYQIDDVFVPNAFALPFGGRHIERGGPWFELPTITFLSPDTPASRSARRSERWS